MSLLLASALDTTLVVAIGLAAGLMLRQRSSALRHLVLAATVASSALTPLFELVVPQVLVVERTVSQAAFSSSVSMTGHMSGTSATDEEAKAPALVSWATVVTSVWIVGVLVMLTALGTSLLRLVHIVRHATPIRAGPWRTAVDRLTKVQRRQPVTILLAAHRSLLITCGLRRPKIIIPAGAEGWGVDRLQVVLAHEVAHIRRLDGMWQLTAELLRALHWFNPLVWIACGRLRRESEYACDDEVLRTGIAPTEYASHLLDVAKHAAGATRAWGPAPAIAQPSTLERRISAMLNRQQNRAVVTRLARSWVVGTIAAAAVSLSAADVVTPSPVASTMAPTRAAEVVSPPPVAAGASVPARREAERRLRTGAPAYRAGTATAPPMLGAAVAQSGATPAAMVGAVVDQTGGAIPGATVTLTSSAAGGRQQALTSADGRFAFRGLEAGPYTLVASFPGFMRISSDVTAGPGSTVDRVLMLPLGTMSEELHVSCSAAQTGRVAPAARRDVLTPFAWLAPGTLVQRGWPLLAQTFAPVVSAAPQDVRPVRVGGAVRPPRKVTDAHPACPGTSMPSADTTVRMVAWIAVDGAVRDVTYVAAPRDAAPSGALIDAAMAAVRQWTYTPALLNGKPQDVQMAIAVVYQRQ